MAKMDEVLSDLNLIHLIKCDVEGHEMQVLEGAETSLKKHRPILMLEINGGISPENENSQNILSFLKALNYDAFSPEDGQLVKVKDASDWHNFFFLTPEHLEKHDKVVRS